MIQSAVSVDAETVCEPEVHNKVAENLEEQLETGISKKKVGFRERKIIEYENRIRQFSTPYAPKQIFSLKSGSPNLMSVAGTKYFGILQLCK